VRALLVADAVRTVRLSEFARRGMLGVAASLSTECDLLEQFILVFGPAQLFFFLAFTALVGGAFIAADALTAAVLSFVGSVGRDINQENSIYFARSWLNFSAIFFCVLASNLVGIVPYSFTLTSSLAAPFFFSIAVFFVCLFTVVSGGRAGLFAGLLPAGTSSAIAPLIVLIEFVSSAAKFVSLGVRLFANMFAGHLLLKVFYSISFQVLCSFSLFMAFAEIFIFIFVFFITGLEAMIAVLQAFVMLLLAALYVREAENFTAGSH
jgi:ATP synthase subunit 6